MHRRSSRRPPVLLSVLAAALAACGEQPPPLQPELFREACEHIFSCDCDAFMYSDLDACMHHKAVAHAGFLALLEESGLQIDEGCLAPRFAPDPDICLTPGELDRRERERWETEGLQPRESVCGECKLAYGDLAVGEPCQETGPGNADPCAPGLFCFTIRGPGVCVDPCVPAAAGEWCADGFNTCADGLYCSVDFVCEPRVPAGGACGLERCEEGLHCNRETGLCEPYGQEGDHCDGDVTCDWEAGLVCTHRSAIPLCVPQGRRGDACLDHECELGLICDPYAKRCTDPREVDENCKEYFHCADGLQCDNGECKPKRGLYEPCYASTCAAGLLCIDDACQPGTPYACAEDRP